MPNPDAYRVACTCGYPLIAVLPTVNPKNKRRPPMVAWSARGVPRKHCPNCKRELPPISVDRFKQLAEGQAEKEQGIGD